MESNIENDALRPTEICYNAFELMHVREYDDAEKLLTFHMSKATDDTAIALYHSTLGVLMKLRGDYKRAWQHYERAEKLLPDDPALKLISARLLIEQFAQYDQAIKKARRALDILPNNPVIAHQAHTTMGLGQLKKGNKRMALENFAQSMCSDFTGFVTAANIDLHLLEALLRRGWGIELCGEFLRKALAFANAIEERAQIEQFSRLWEAYQAEYPQPSQEPIV